MSRYGIYYWKCDRPSAFQRNRSNATNALTEQFLGEELQDYFNASEILLSTGGGQGNHLTWKADVDGIPMFVRVENGPENDNHLAVESALLNRVRRCGVRTPVVHGFDATRTKVPFAWQALERVDAPDLNHWYKKGCLDISNIAFEIGVAVAKWQSVILPGFGVLDKNLRGYHKSYSEYFHLQLKRHLTFLMESNFLTTSECSEILVMVADHKKLLDIECGCLVHKDLALWNILGSSDRIDAFIDFDDAISGDPMDDISLLGCFHDFTFLKHTFEGYQSFRPLPWEHRRRFWLHMLRNMIVKAVIRVGAGFFEKDDQFFLIPRKSSGTSLEQFTRNRLAAAMRGLRENQSIEHLV